MSEEQKATKNIWDMMSPQQTFFVGLVGGAMVLCTIGFFLLLGIMIKGGMPTRANAAANIDDEVAAGPEKFSACLDDGKYANTVKADMQLGASLGVNGTPATFINGYLLSGALPYSALKQVVDTVLAGNTPDFDFMKDRETGKIVKVDMPELPNVEWAGNESASVTVVEFSDFECPYCANFEPSIEQLLAEYSDKIKFTYRHFPLSFHANAQKAAEAFECAKEQGKWLEMHNKLFDLSAASNLSLTSYKKAATELGLK
ncbi:MAG TPA: hypothetical protein DCS29_00250 [Candidatus Magasanikbacteria bacterium]|nr:hypothetical protein [Candidatus Magasanikbacteria bacterium]